jgi:hypothetical protein
MVCALWSAPENDDGTQLDSEHDTDDFSDEAKAEMKKDCDDFEKANADDLEETGADDGRNGHDFCLTRNRHGAGFWDRGYGKVGDRLTEAAHAHGESNVYKGDDGKLYIM